MPRVTTIQPTRARFTEKPITQTVIKNVAAYARVSTDHEEQQNSYEAQMDYFTRLIKSKPEWKFAGMYSDEGISATNTKKRDGFNSMIEDALAGKIDLIITKSVSRFARNTVDSLTTIRQLKEKGVDVYFEKENIHTLDAKGELLLTIMSSLAQEESRSISENTTWGTRKKMSDGKFAMAYSRFLGYDKGPDGTMVINEEQAKTVRLIYKLYFDGLSLTSIVDELTKRGLPTPSGTGRWHQEVIASILTNEKYKGDALLQKSYVCDFLTKKTRKNTGEVPQYYVEDSHEGIVSKEVFELAQQERLKRQTRGFSGKTIFCSRIRCGECGGWYGCKVWHSKDKYRKRVYRCNNKYKGEKHCETPTLEEDEIKATFVTALNQLIGDKDEVTANVAALIDTIEDTTALEREQADIADEMEVLVRMTEDIIAENARTALDQTDYNRRYESLVVKYDAKKKRHEELEAEVKDRRARAEHCREFVKELSKMDGEVTEWDDRLWAALLQEMVVYKDRIEVIFKSGIQVEVNYRGARHGIYRGNQGIATSEDTDGN